MSGYVVTVNHLGKHYDIRVSDTEVAVKFSQFKKDCPQLADQVSEEDIAEMVANNKIAYAIDVKDDSRQRWIRGERCSYCGAMHRMVTSTLTSATLANVLFKSKNILGDFSSSGINMPQVYACEKCFETEFSTCERCHIDLPNRDISDGLCISCASETPLKYRRVQAK